MRRTTLVFILFLKITLLQSQLIHSDKLEFGYKGSVKTIVKKNFTNNITGDSVDLNARIPSSINYYYFNKNGSIDSTKNSRISNVGDTTSYATIYSFKDGKKAEWSAIDESGTQLLKTKIGWNSEKLYTEDVYGANGKLRFQTASQLNDSFRLEKMISKVYDTSGNMLQNDIQYFYFDHLGNISYFETKRLLSGTKEFTTYSYLNFDTTGNPIRLLLTQELSGKKTFISIEYEYY